MTMARPQGDHASVVDANQWEKAVQAYLACITFADAQIGRLLDALDDERRTRKNTIVVLWGDHGWHLGEKQHWRKFALWEEATRVPLIVVAPGVTKAGQRCDRTVDLLDLYPTLVELCGLPPKKGLEGQSLVPAAEGPEGGVGPPGAHDARPRTTTRSATERWRYIRYADGSEELYDHDADPLEWKNLAGDAAHADGEEGAGGAAAEGQRPGRKDYAMSHVFRLLTPVTAAFLPNIILI